ncbi:MAG TPA: multicopper oxidase [Gemmatimonadota bacterium]|jgi:bilirubin oxidase
MLTRRQFLKLGAATGAGAMAPWAGLGCRTRIERTLGPVPGNPLDPTTIPKYVISLIAPPTMPRTASVNQPGRGPIDYYEIAVRQFKQQILPTGMPTTRVWSYGSVNHPGTFTYPAFTFEARFDQPIRVKWINDLKTADGDFLPHLLAVDPSLHWANPPGGASGRDSRPMFGGTPGSYTGPVPIVTHLHGGHNSQESDGYAEAWFLPAARNIPTGFATEGAWYDLFRAEFLRKWGVAWEPGTAIFQYENDQPAAMLWYHDHTLGMTRLNVYAGPVGFYILREGPGDLPTGVIPGPAPGPGADPSGRHFEIPLAIQDRSFHADGSLFYPDTRDRFDGFPGPYVPDTDVPPIWNPEVFADTIVVNGRTWPFLEIEPRRYRFRVLNGCNSRFLILKLVTDPLATRPAEPVLPFWQIGADGGFLPAPVLLDSLLLGPAERADVIVDFTRVPVSTQLYLINEGPDEPFRGGRVGAAFAPAHPATTGQVMMLRVIPLTGTDQSLHPAQLALPAFEPLGRATVTRKLSLKEEVSAAPGFDGPIAARLGTLDGAGNPVPMGWDDPITENPALNDTEVWEIHNFTEDAHTIHIHEVEFQVVDRQPIEGGVARQPESWEAGLKDTVIAYPEEVTRVKALFDRPGLFVWHCHILEHEDNEMMRPYFIGPNPPNP